MEKRTLHLWYRLRPLIPLVSLATACLLATGAAAQSFPSKPIRMIVPNAPGGATDVAARLVAPKLAEQLGQPVVVENRVGAAAVTGTNLAAQAAPDGYTLVMVSDSFTMNPYLYKNVQYDPIRGTRIKTGDLAVMDADGFVRVTGRTKDVIIRSGINISPQEVDEVLLAHAQVTEAAAVGVPDPIYGGEVVCYVSLKPGEKLDGDSILAYCSTRLPLPKVPKHVVVVSELPKSDGGKVLRDQLRADWCRRMEAGKGVHHKNSVEEN